MAISLVGYTVPAPNVGVPISVARAGCTQGNGLIIIFNWNGTTPLASVAMSGETVTLVGSLNSDNQNVSHQFAYVKQLQSGGTKTLTASDPGNWYEIGILEVSGQDTTDFYDAATLGWAKGSTGNPTVNIVTSVANAFVVGMASSNSGNPTVGSGYTVLTFAGVKGDNLSAYVEGEYNADAGVAGTKTVNMVHTSNFWGMMAAAFKPGAAAPANWGRMLGGELNRLVRPIYD